MSKIHLNYFQVSSKWTIYSQKIDQCECFSTTLAKKNRYRREIHEVDPTVRSCEIVRYRASVRHWRDPRLCASRARVADRSRCRMISHDRTADQSHEFLGWNDFFGQGSLLCVFWCQNVINDGSDQPGILAYNVTCTSVQWWTDGSMCFLQQTVTAFFTLHEHAPLKWWVELLSAICRHFDAHLNYWSLAKTGLGRPARLCKEHAGMHGHGQNPQLSVECEIAAFHIAPESLHSGLALRRMNSSRTHRLEFLLRIRT